ncbi:MAG: hypothetical protein R3F15_04885 [Lysobacterales bacterium]
MPWSSNRYHQGPSLLEQLAMTRTHGSRLTRWMPLAFALTALPGVGFAAEGVRAYVDPETGQLTSRAVTPEQQQADAQATEFSQDATQVELATAADGSPMYILNGQFEMALTAQTRADGSLQLGCTQIEHQGLSAEAHAHAHPSAPTDDQR